MSRFLLPALLSLLLAACQSEKPAPKDAPSFSARLSCKVRYFEYGKDTGNWTDGVVMLINDHRVNLIYNELALGEWELVVASFQSIKFRSDNGKGTGELNRLNGDLMVYLEGKLMMNGNCEKAVQRF